MTNLTGQCLCGAVSYDVATEPVLVAICHCTHCRRQSGSAFSVNALVARSAYSQRGTTRVFNDQGSSGGPVYRHFCPSCGSPILSALPDLPDHFLIKAGTADSPSDLRPTHEYWCDSALSWAPQTADTIRIGRDK